MSDPVWFGKVTHDTSVDMCYIYLAEGDMTARTVLANQTVVERDGELRYILDEDAFGRLLGIEVFGARGLQPEALRHANAAQDPANLAIQTAWREGHVAGYKKAGWQAVGIFFATLLLQILLRIFF